MTPINVLIVDDHAIVRTGLKHMLENEDDIQLVGEATDGVAGLEMAKQLQPDVAVFDIAMPKLSGLEALAQMKRWAPDVKVILLSMYAKESFAQEALQAGAHGYILKGAPGSDLIDAIRAAHDGRYFFSREVHANVIRSYSQRPDAHDEADEGYYTLTDREKQAFRLLVEGYSTAEIADQLSISIKTAEKYRTAIAKKLDTKNVIEMMKIAVRIGLVDPETWKSEEA